MRVGLPQDTAQWIAAALGVAAAIFAPLIARPARRRALFVVGAAITAAALSTLYIALYLRGGPRIIDATSYWLEARAISEGLLRFPIDEPVASTLGRFLVRSDGPDGPGASVIFPPGYPALLALGFRVGAPLVVGPILAAALVFATYDLGEQIAESLGRGRAADVHGSPGPAASIGQIAALLSVVCGALRYHTADTMSHGLSALCFSASLALALRALKQGAPGRARSASLSLGAGLFLGWLAATRPATSLALAATLGALLACERAAPIGVRARLAALIGVGSLPGLALLAMHQRAATGALGSSSQALYYALSDGPAGCFRYGFGANIGCVGEHGDFVQANMPHGYGAFEATMTTLRRLKMHLVDAANAEPLALLIPAGAALGRRSPRVLLLALGALLVVAAYVPFYFDGNYPGGGARFFADVLPLEHVLIAVAAVVIAERRRAPEPRAARAAGSVVALALAGFAVRSGFEHAALRDREGGRPMFEPALLAAAGASRGLVFLDTDHGFNLAFDPAPGPDGLHFARSRGGDLDRMAWEARGRPPAYRYRFLMPEGGGVASIAVDPASFVEGSNSTEPRRWVIEGEALWPAFAQDRAFALAEYASGTCASDGRLLAVHAPRGASDDDASSALPSVLISLPAPWIRGAVVEPTIAAGDDTTGVVTLVLDGKDARSWPVPIGGAAARGGAGLRCVTLDGALIPPSTREASLRIARSPTNLRRGGASIVALDKIEAAPPRGGASLEKD